MTEYSYARIPALGSEEPAELERNYILYFNSRNTLIATILLFPIEALFPILKGADNNRIRIFLAIRVTHEHDRDDDQLSVFHSYLHF